MADSRFKLSLQLGGKLFAVDLGKKLFDGFGAHADAEFVSVVFVFLIVFLLGEKLHFFKAGRFARIDDDILGKV